jgi:hypothetical protein
MAVVLSSYTVVCHIFKGGMPLLCFYFAGIVNKGIMPPTLYIKTSEVKTNIVKKC